jgi:hypothetical protein
MVVQLCMCEIGAGFLAEHHILTVSLHTRALTKNRKFKDDLSLYHASIVSDSFVIKLSD